MHNVFNLHDITFLNSYRVIGASVTPAGYYSITHEQLHLSNIKGTCLRVGAYLTNSSEVGTFDNIIFNNRYWANAGEEYNAPDIRNLNDFTTKNGVGMILGDLEWQEITMSFLPIIILVFILLMGPVTLSIIWRLLVNFITYISLMPNMEYMSKNYIKIWVLNSLNVVLKVVLMP